MARRRRGSKEIVIERQGPELEKLMDTLPMEIKRHAVDEALTKASGIVLRAARSRVPIGDPNHHPERKPLKETIGRVIRKYRSGNAGLAVIGPEWPAGAHGYNVEFGHEIKSRGPNRKGSPPLTGKTRAKAKRFMAPAVDNTKQHQHNAITQTLVKYIKKAEQKSA